MIVDVSACMDLAEIFRPGGDRISHWIGGLLAEVGGSGTSPCRPVSRFTGNVVDMSPRYVPVMTPDLVRDLSRIVRYVDMVEGIHPEWLDDLLSASFQTALGHANLLIAAVVRIRADQTNVVDLVSAGRKAI
jgi:hypothetical protein